jgi:hypothetical protein
MTEGPAAEVDAGHWVQYEAAPAFDASLLELLGATS